MKPTLTRHLVTHHPKEDAIPILSIEHIGKEKRTSSWWRLWEFQLWPKNLFKIDLEFEFDNDKWDISLNKVVIFDDVSDHPNVTINLIPVFGCELRTPREMSTQIVSTSIEIPCGRAPGISIIKFRLIRGDGKVWVESDEYRVVVPK